MPLPNVPCCNPLCTCCLDLTKQRASYLCQLEHNVKKLKEKTSTLVSAKTDMKARVEAAELKGMTVLSMVENWFTKVETAETEVGELIKGSRQHKLKLWVGCCCSECTPSCNIGERVVTQLDAMAELINEGNEHTKEVAAKLAVIPGERIPLEPDLLDRESLFDLIWTSLRGNEAAIIGLHGTGGTGKTTLLQQINNKLCMDRSRDFDVVIYVEELKDQPLEKIQNTIARRFGLYDESWENEKNVNSRAPRLLRILQNKRFVLFLDGIWEQIELHRVGVPTPQHDKASRKIVFTTRFYGICIQMQALEFEVGRFGPVQAWEYFQRKVGDRETVNLPSIHDDAKRVVEGCDGIPLLLKIVGHHMSGKKKPEQWRHAANTIPNWSDHDINEEKVHECLSLSYDDLPGERKSCFLYCSLFSAGYKISKRDLIDYWIGEGLLEKNDAENCRGISIIDDLVAVFLLKEDEDGNHVELDRRTRAMALWKARNEQQRIFVKANAELNEAPWANEWQGAQRMSVMENIITTLVETPDCPRLLTLFLNHNRLQKINDGFFQKMPLLRVLNLSQNLSLNILPEEIAKLVSLEHLDLSSTNIRKLSEKLKALKKLKCLNLENTSELHTIPKNLISSFSMLRVLRMLNCGSRTPKRNSLLFGNGDTLILELLCLTRLEMLSISLTSSISLRKFLRSPVLTKSTQSLCLQSIDNFESLKLRVENLKILETLHVSGFGDDLKEVKIACRVDTPITFGLKVVSIKSCQKLMDLTCLCLILASSLKRLKVSDCSEMRDIINDTKLHEVAETMRRRTPFFMLEYLELEQLPELKSVHKEVLPFENLKEIKVVQCVNLKKLPLNYENAQERKFVIRGQIEWWNKLKSEDHTAENASCRFVSGSLEELLKSSSV